jgi:molecular chaperone DnaJ
MDPYQILGVSSDVSDEEITKAYRRMAKKYHPDVNPDDPLSAKKMTAINNAYDEIQRRRSHATDGFAGSNPWGSQSDFPQGDLQTAETFLSQGRTEEALRILQTLTDRSARWHYLCAAAFANLGNRSVARQYIAAAVRMDPENADYRDLEAILNRRTEGWQGGSRPFSPLSWLWKGFVVVTMVRWFFQFLLG